MGILVASLGVAIGHTALVRPRTGTSEPLGRGPVSGGLGRIAGLVPVSQLGEDQFLVAQGGSHYRTNELIGEDGNVVIRLAPVAVKWVDDCVSL